MGCKGSSERPAGNEPAAAASTGGSTSLAREPPSRIPSGTVPRTIIDDDNPMVPCPDCKVPVRKKELDKHSRTCPERQVACPNGWCTEVMERHLLAAHIDVCMQRRKEHCPKCGELFPVMDISQHKADCTTVKCNDCQEVCLPRLLKYCPHKILGVDPRVGPFASEAIEEAMERKHGSRGDMHTHCAVARLQHTWRWLKTKAVFEDLVFRVIYKELDHKKEGFAIFKAHDMTAIAGRSESAANRSNAPFQAKPAQPNHYFPSAAKEPITEDIAKRMVEDIASGRVVPYHAAWRVFNDAHARLKTMANVSRVTPPSGARQLNGRWVQGGKTIVVGDLHGQLADLLHILHDHGFPSDTTWYVYNGDFVDRGQHGFEVAFILFMLFVVFPKFVFLNRGNHECDYMNEEYGFDLEVQRKFDRNIYKIIQKCFCALPLATVIGKKIFVVHGGLPRRGDVTLDQIYDINRFRVIPIPEEHQSIEDEIFQDLMWADPWETPGWADSDRGVGSLFGPDVTDHFMQLNGFELVIRSHEVFEKGYEEHHKRKVLTVFSASNYDGPESNSGAVITIIGDQTEVSVSQFQTTDDDIASYGLVPVSAEPMSTTYSRMTTSFSFATGSAFDVEGRTFRGHNMSLLGNMNALYQTMASAGPLAAHGAAFSLSHGHRERRSRDDVLRTLRERIYTRRARLLAYFTKIDKSRKGTVWKMEWVEVLRHTLNIEVPFFFLRKYMAETEPVTNRINYLKFLRRFQNLVREAWIRSWEHHMILYIANLYRTRHQQALADLETENCITFIDFCSKMRVVDPLMSEGQAFSLYMCVDQHDHGFIKGDDLRELLLVARPNSDSTGMNLHAAANLGRGPLTVPSQSPPPDGGGSSPMPDLSRFSSLIWEHDVMDQILQIIGSARSQLTTTFCPDYVRGNERLLVKEHFLSGMGNVMNGIKKQQQRLTPQHLECLWAYIDGTCADPKVGPTFDDFINMFVIRDLKMLRPSTVQLARSRTTSFSFGTPGMFRKSSVGDVTALSMKRQSSAGFASPKCSVPPTPTVASLRTSAAPQGAVATRPPLPLGTSLS